MTVTIGRRKFLTAIGSSAAWPFVARAQGDRVRRIGVLMSNAEDDALGQKYLAEFRAALGKLGWSEGRGIAFDVRWDGLDDERRRSHVVDLVSRTPDVILAYTAPVALALKQATATIPIVFASGSDPVRNGLVTNFALPGGNVTGFPATEPSLAGKWLELLRMLAPAARRTAVVEPPENPVLAEYWDSLQSAAEAPAFELTKIETRSGAQLGREIAEFAATPGGTLLVLPGPSTGRYTEVIVTAAARHRLPAIYPFRSYVVAGGLMGYGADTVGIFRSAAGYVDRILRGEAPGNLPVQFPTKFELAINLKTARALGLAMPTNLLVAADELIE